MNRLVEQALAPTFRGLPVARVLLDVRDEPGIEDRLAIARGIEPTIQVEIRLVQVQPRQLGYPVMLKKSAGATPLNSCGFTVYSVECMR